MAYQRDFKVIPGYTGFAPAQEENNVNLIEKPGHYIPGYAGFVKGIKSENMYAHTFGQTTQDSVECTYHKGHDLPAQERFKTTVQEKYDDVMIKRREDHFSFTRLSTDNKAHEKDDLANSFYNNTTYGKQNPNEVNIEYDDCYKK